ncbi:hypothetical protein HRbin20_00862 [bacterium HR20]|nr:hypothetical protein HRbin20_00862 [bacterium HR20]
MPAGLGAGTYVYTLVVTCGSCNATSNSVTVAVSPAPSVSISAGGSTSLCTGYSSGPVLSSSVSNCSGTASYQWKLNGNPISGATSSSYTVPAGLTAGTYVYTLVVTCGSCSATSNSVTVTVSQPPSVTISCSSSQNSTSFTLTSTALGISAGNYGTSYSIGGSSGIVLTARSSVDPTQPTNPTASGQTGIIYIGSDGVGVKNSGGGGSQGISGGGGDQDEEVKITFAAGAVPAGTIVLGINKLSFSSDTPVLFIHKTDGTYVTVQESELQSVITWTASDRGEVDFSDLSSISSSAMVDFIVLRETADHIFLYSISFGGGCSTIALCSGYASGPTLTSSVSGCSGSVSYQWMKNGNPISGATASTYTVPTGLSTGNHTYTLVVTCGGCSVTSNSITVVVTAAPSVSISASGSTNLCAGYSSGPTLTSSVSNCSGTASYQWKLNGNPISGATSSTYTVPAGLGTGTYTYTLVVTCGSCSATSNSVTVTVSQQPSITLSGGTTICSGGSVTLTFTLTSGNSTNWSLTYSATPTSGSPQQFTVNNINGTTYSVNVSPTVTTTYSVVSVTAGGCTVTPSNVSTTVTVNSIAVSATVQNDGTTVTICSTATQRPTLVASVTGCSGTPTYQWRRNGSNISGATQSTYTIPTGLAAGTYQYSVYVTCGGCTATSNNVTVTVTSIGTVTIAIQGTSSTNVTYCQNQQGGTLYVVQPTSGIVSYQWYADGSPISGATNSTYVIPTSQTGTKNYTVKVTDAGGCEKFSNAICVNVVSAPTVSISTSNTEVCPGTQIAVYFTFSGCGPWHLTYKINNGSNITVQTSSNPYILTYTITQPTTFTVVSVQNCNGCSGSISGPSSLTVSPFGIPSSYFVMGFTGDTVTTNSNGYVLGWPNYAGDGSNYPDGSVNASSDANRPKHYPNYSALNGHGAIYWDGNDRPVQVQVNTGSGISGGTQKTLFIVYRPTSTSLSNNRMVIYKQGDENHGLAIYLINRQVYYGAWNNQNCSGSCTNKWAVFQSTGFTVQPGTNYIFQFVYNGNASSSNRLRFSINGNVYSPSGTPGTSMSYSGDAVSIGGKVGNTRFHDFASVNETNQYLCDNTKIAEVLLYNTADATLRDQVWCVLKYKYGFTNLGNNPIGVLSKDGGSDEREPIAGEPLAPAEEATLSPVAPNPSEQFATAVLTVGRQQYVEVSIIGLDGRAYATVFAGYVARGERRELVIDVGTLPSGVYLLSVQGEYFVRSERFVVQH